MTPKRLISREEVLGGLPAKQASALVFAIERRTAYLADQARYVMASYLTESVIEARNQAFLLAFAQGAKLPVQPSIQEVERFAPDWATLVPDNASMPAAASVHLTYADDERRLHAADGHIPRFGALQRLTIAVPATGAKELKVWVHRLLAEGESIVLPVRLALHSGGQQAGSAGERVESAPSTVELVLDTGQTLLLLSRGPFQLVLTFDAQPQREAVDGAFSARSVG